MCSTKLLLGLHICFPNCLEPQNPFYFSEHRSLTMGEMIIKPRMWDEKIASYANNGRTSSNVRAAAANLNSPNRHITMQNRNYSSDLGRFHHIFMPKIQLSLPTSNTYYPQHLHDLPTSWIVHIIVLVIS